MSVSPEDPAGRAGTPEPAEVAVHAPFAGVARALVAPGAEVAAGEAIAVVEAVKLEAPVVAPCPGTVAEALPGDFADVAGGDVLARIRPAGEGC